jgi:hypothetical protein
MAVSAHGEWMDQCEEGNAVGGHAGEVEAIPYRAVPSPVTEPPRRFPAPWRADKIAGGYIVRDATGQAISYVYSRANATEALQAKMLTEGEARRVSVNIARLPELLGKSDRD